VHERQRLAGPDRPASNRNELSDAEGWLGSGVRCWE